MKVDLATRIQRKHTNDTKKMCSLFVYNSIQEHSAVYCGDELNADMSSSFGGIPRSLERGGCHIRDIRVFIRIISVEMF